MFDMKASQLELYSRPVPRPYGLTSDHAKMLREKMHANATKQYQQYMVVWESIFDKALESFREERSECVKRAAKILNPDNGPVDAELQAKLDELTRTEFLKIADRFVVNPALYENWHNDKPLVRRSSVEELSGLLDRACKVE